MKTTKLKTDPFDAWLVGVFFGGAAAYIAIYMWQVDADMVAISIMVLVYLAKVLVSAAGIANELRTIYDQ